MSLTHFKHFIFATALVAISGNAIAGEKWYYHSQPYRCLDKSMFMNAEVVPSDSEIAFNILMTNTKKGHRDLAQFTINKANISKGSAIVNSRYNSPWLKVGQLDNLSAKSTVSINLLTSDGKLSKKCDNVKLTPTQTPAETLQKEIETLEKRPIDSRQLLVAQKQYDTSPPIAWLPDLDQAGVKARREKAWDEFNDAYLPALVEQFEKPDISTEEAEAILTGMFDTTKVIKSSPYRKSIRDKIDDFHIYWALIKRNQPQEAKHFAVSSQAELCDAMYYTYDWQTTLRWTSGLPLPMWSRDYGNQLLDWAAQCKSSESKKFRAYLKDNWPAIEKMSKNYPNFVAMLNQRLAAKANIEELKKNNWLFFTNEQKKSLGVPKVMVTMAEKKLIAPYLQSLLPALGAELQKGLAQLPNVTDYRDYCRKTLDFGRTRSAFKKQLAQDCEKFSQIAYDKKLTTVVEGWLADADKDLQSGKISIADLGSYCRTKARAVDGWSVRDKLAERCQPLLAERSLAMVKKRVAALQKDIESQPKTLAGLEKLNAIAMTLKPYDVNYPLVLDVKTAEAINAAMKPAQQALETAYKDIDASSAASLSKIYQPLIDGEDDANKLAKAVAEIKIACGGRYEYNHSLPQYEYNHSLPQYDEACRKLSRDLADKQETLACDAIWEKTDFPDEYALKLLPDPRGRRDMTLRAVLCVAGSSVGANRPTLVGVKDSGLLSSDYLLKATHPQKSGKDLVVTLELEEADDGEHFAYTNLKISEGELDLSRLQNKEKELFLCLVQPERCLKK